MPTTNKSDSEQMQPHRCDVLVVTATGVETRAVLDVFYPPDTALKRYPLGDNTYFDLGIVGGARTFLVQCEMGSGGPAGATLVVHEAIKALLPVSVIMVGIAFGMRPHEQKLGDILVSRQLSGYELQKIGQGIDGEEVIRPRGDRVQASPRLLSRLRASIFDWNGAAVHFGLILSGEKLVNHKDFRDKLLRIEPEAIGGEMEGAGVYAAANRSRVDWILMKAICDWADGQKGDAYQQQAAKNAALFLFHALQQGGLTENNSGPSPQAEAPKKLALPGRDRGTLLRKYDIHSNYVVEVAWQPYGNRIASAGGEGLVRIWEVDTGQTLLTYRGHSWFLQKISNPTIYTLAWSPEGLRIASTGTGGNVRVWNADTGQDITSHSGPFGVLRDVFALAWSPDGKLIASACSSIGTNKTVHIWNATTGAKILQYDGKRGLFPHVSVSALAWSPDRKHIASVYNDKTLHIWNPLTGQTISIFKTNASYVYRIAWSPDSQYLALANGNYTAEILHASTGRVVLTYRGHHDSVRDIAWSPDSSHLATASNDKTIHLWNAETGVCFYRYIEHTDWATSVSWSPDGRFIASGSNDRTVHVWQTVEGS